MFGIHRDSVQHRDGSSSWLWLPEWIPNGPKLFQNETHTDKRGTPGRYFEIWGLTFEHLEGCILAVSPGPTETTRTWSDPPFGVHFVFWSLFSKCRSGKQLRMRMSISQLDQYFLCMNICVKFGSCQEGNDFEIAQCPRM